MKTKEKIGTMVFVAFNVALLTSILPLFPLECYDTHLQYCGFNDACCEWKNTYNPSRCTSKYTEFVNIVQYYTEGCPIHYGTTPFQPYDFYMSLGSVWFLIVFIYFIGLAVFIIQERGK